MKKRLLDETRSGLTLAAKWIAAISWVVFVAFSTGMAYSDNFDRHVMGWGCLVLAAFVASITAEMWIGILPGVLGLGIINGLYTIWSGHGPTNASKPIPRFESVLIVLTLLACSVLALTFRSRKLRIRDRAALLAFLVAQLYAISRFPSLAGFGLMLLSLFIPWGIDRLQKNNEALMG